MRVLRKIKQEEADSEFLYIGTTDRMEKDLIPNLDIPYVGIEIEGFVRKLSPENIKTLVKFFKARRKCLKIIKEFKPDVVIGAGSVVTKDIRSHTICVGNPCHVIREITNEERQYWRGQGKKWHDMFDNK